MLHCRLSNSFLETYSKFRHRVRSHHLHLLANQIMFTISPILQLHQVTILSLVYWTSFRFRICHGKHFWLIKRPNCNRVIGPVDTAMVSQKALSVRHTNFRCSFSVPSGQVFNLWWLWKFQLLKSNWFIRSINKHLEFTRTTKVKTQLHFCDWEKQRISHCRCSLHRRR